MYIYIYTLHGTTNAENYIRKIPLRRGSERYMKNVFPLYLFQLLIEKSKKKCPQS